MNSEIKEYLFKLGLSESEAVLYIKLLELGKATVLELSRYTNINRSSVHFSINNLINNGLISETRIGNRRIIVPEDINKLDKIIDSKIKDMNSLKKDLRENLFKQKNRGDKDSKDEVDLKCYKGIPAVKSVYLETLEADKVYSFTNLDQYYKSFPGSRNLFIEALKRNPNRVVKTIATDSYISRQLNKCKKSVQYQSKFVQANFVGDIDIHVFDDNLAIISLKNDNPVAIIVKSHAIASAMIEIHKLLWNAI